MPSYSELMAQAQELMAQAEEARKAEQATIVAEIKATMAQHGITLADLGGKAAKSSKPKGEAKYRGPKGELWAGGLGRKPFWVATLLAAGDDIEKYRI